MKNYLVSFTYTVEVKADDNDDAYDKGYDEFRDQLLRGLGAGEFAQHDPEEKIVVNCTHDWEYLPDQETMHCVYCGTHQR